MSCSDREHWTIDDWRNYALELEKILDQKPKKHKKRGAPRKHPKEFVGAVIYRIVLAKLEGNKLTAKEALADELNKRGKGRWRAEEEYRAVLNEVSNRKYLRNILEAALIQQQVQQLELKLIKINECLKFFEDTNRHEASQFGLADAIGPDNL